MGQVEYRHEENNSHFLCTASPFLCRGHYRGHHNPNSIDMIYFKYHCHVLPSGPVTTIHNASCTMHYQPCTTNHALTTTTHHAPPLPCTIPTITHHAPPLPCTTNHHTPCATTTMHYQPPPPHTTTTTMHYQPPHTMRHHYQPLWSTTTYIVILVRELPSCLGPHISSGTENIGDRSVAAIMISFPLLFGTAK